MVENTGSLHPNLARLAAEYDMICEQVTIGVLTPAAGRERIEQLEARDDDGVRWSIDATSGQWFRKTAFGDAHYDTTPPTYGYPSLTAHDLTSTPTVANPQDRVLFAHVDENQLPQTGLKGATRTQHRHTPTPPKKQSKALRLSLWFGAATLIILLWHLLS